MAATDWKSEVANKGICRGWNHCRVGPVESIHATCNLENQHRFLMHVLGEANSNEWSKKNLQYWSKVRLAVRQRCVADSLGLACKDTIWAGPSDHMNRAAPKMDEVVCAPKFLSERGEADFASDLFV